MIGPIEKASFWLADELGRNSLIGKETVSTKFKLQSVTLIIHIFSCHDQKWAPGTQEESNSKSATSSNESLVTGEETHSQF